jgi:hypothetical protein
LYLDAKTGTAVRGDADVSVDDEEFDLRDVC